MNEKHWNRTRLFTTALAVVASFALVQSAVAQNGVVVNLGDIKGESVSRDYSGWIIASSVSTSWNMPSAAATGASRRRGNVAVGDIIVAKRIDKSSPLIMKALATGRVLPAASIIVQGRNSIAVRYDLRNAKITNYEVSADGGSNEDQFSLSYDEIKVTYAPKTPNETSFEWNRTTNK